MRTLVFDFGNVVAFFDHRRALRHLLPHTDMAEADLFATLYGSDWEDRYERGRLTTDEFVAGALERGRLRRTADEFLAAYVDIFWPNPEVCRLLPALASRYRLVLASNTNPAHFARFAEQFAEELRPFGKIVTSHEAGARKPEPDYFAYCQRFTEAEPGECLFVDDLPANVAGAEAFGWRGLVYRPGADLPAELARFGVTLPAGVR